MSAADAGGGKLSATLRTMFDAMLRPHVRPELGADAPAPAAPPGSLPPGEGLPAQQPAPRMLTGPGPAAAASPDGGQTPARPPAGTLVQAGFFEPPGAQPGSRAMFLKDFIARYHEAMRRGGLTARDPLHPVLTMLGEMLVHFTHLQADHTTASGRAADHIGGRVREEAARAQAGIAGEAREISRAAAQGASRIEAAAADVKQARAEVLQSFHKEAEALLLKAVATQARAYTWNTWAYTAGMLALILAALTGSAYWYGRHVEREDMAFALEATKAPLVAATMRDGKAAAEHWLHLMQWNHLDKANKTCGTQQDGIGYRAVCSYAFWDSQPLDPPPAPPVVNPR